MIGHRNVPMTTIEKVMLATILRQIVSALPNGMMMTTNSVFKHAL